MRVLLTTHAFLPGSVAGVEVYTARLAGALQDLGHTVRILTAAHDLSAPPHTVRHRAVGSHGAGQYRASSGSASHWRRAPASTRPSTGFRAEEELGFNAEPYVRTGKFVKILGL